MFTTEAHVVPIGRYWMGTQLPVGGVGSRPVLPPSVASSHTSTPSRTHPSGRVTGRQPHDAAAKRGSTVATGAGGDDGGNGGSKGMGWQLLGELGRRLLSWGASHFPRRRANAVDFATADYCRAALCVCLSTPTGAPGQPLCVADAWWATTSYTLNEPLHVPAHIAAKALAAEPSPTQAGSGDTPAQAEPSVVELPMLGRFSVVHTPSHAWIRRESTGVVRCAVWGLVAWCAGPVMFISFETMQYSSTYRSYLFVGTFSLSEGSCVATASPLTAFVPWLTHPCLCCVSRYAGSGSRQLGFATAPSGGVVGSGATVLRPHRHAAWTHHRVLRAPHAGV